MPTEEPQTSSIDREALKAELNKHLDVARENHEFSQDCFGPALVNFAFRQPLLGDTSERCPGLAGFFGTLRRVIDETVPRPTP